MTSDFAVAKYPTTPIKSPNSPKWGSQKLSEKGAQLRRQYMKSLYGIFLGSKIAAPLILRPCSLFFLFIYIVLLLPLIVVNKASCEIGVRQQEHNDRLFSPEIA